MNSPVPVLVEWVVGPDGRIPAPSRHVTMATFAGYDDTAGAWSIVLEFSEVPSTEPTRATARFLVPKGPVERLQPGVEFEMRAGFTVTARVTVI